MKIEIIGEWKEDLIWCPSQLYLPLKYGEHLFVIYLRWRHSDPWSATLIQTNDIDDITSKDTVCYNLDIDYFKDHQYPDLKEYILSFVKKFIYSGEMNLVK